MEKQKTDNQVKENVCACGKDCKCSQTDCKCSDCKCVDCKCAQKTCKCD